MPRPGAAPDSARLAGFRTPRASSPSRLARRRFMVVWTKRLLPVAAAALLTTVALWPELTRNPAEQRIAFRLAGVSPDSAEMTAPRYQSTDAKGRPYTVTARSAVQTGQNRVDLTAPKADMTTENGEWVMVQAQRGVFMQRDNQLDLSGDVTLYRDDGITLTTHAATLDLRAGAAAGSDRTHAEGPFGTLDAQGFALTDKGAVVQFTGPARLVLNGANAGNAAAGGATGGRAP